MENKESGGISKIGNVVGKGAVAVGNVVGNVGKSFSKAVGSVGSVIRSATNNKTNNNESKSDNNNIEIDEVNHDIFFVDPKNKERLYEVRLFNYNNNLIQDYKDQKNRFIEQKNIYEERSKENNEESLLDSGAGGFTDKDQYRIKDDLLINSNYNNAIRYAVDDVNGEKKGKLFDVKILNQTYRDTLNKTSSYFKLKDNKLFFVNDDSTNPEIVDEVKDFNLVVDTRPVAGGEKGGSKSAQNKLVKNHRKNTQNRRLKKRRYTNKRSNRRK